MTTLDVITGFLGAGKTTFLARYSNWLKERNISFCIIENEFGRAGVDGALLMRDGLRVKEISGGCVCCTLKVTLHDMLRELSGEVERVILEPSGLFCGDDLLDILHSPQIEGKVRLGMWVGILDPLCAPVLGAEDIEVLRSELMAAGSLVLSKAQLCPAEDMDGAVAFADALFEGAPPMLWREPWDTYPDDEWFPALWAAGAVERPHERRRFDHAAMFQSASFGPDAPLDGDELRERLARLLDGAAGCALRIKGTLNARGGGSWQINCTPGCVLLKRGEERLPAMLNVIGRGLERKAVRRILEDNGDD